MNVVQCPSCDRSLQVPESLMGAQVKCPKCQNVFTAGGPGAAPPPPPPAPEDEPRERFSDAPSERPPTPRRDDDFDRGRDRDWERDRNRGRWRDEDDYDFRRGRGPDRETARAAVNGPATALMVTGGLAIGLSVLGLILNVVGAVLVADANGMAEEDAFAVGRGLGSATFGIAWGTLIFIGARKMKNLESYGFAMTACIVAMLPCNGCCLLGLPFGIWGLTVLNQPHVKDAFETGGNSPSRPRRDYG